MRLAWRAAMTYDLDDAKDVVAFIDSELKRFGKDLLTKTLVDRAKLFRRLVNLGTTEAKAMWLKVFKSDLGCPGRYPDMMDLVPLAVLKQGSEFHSPISLLLHRRPSERLPALGKQWSERFLILLAIHYRLINHKDAGRILTLARHLETTSLRSSEMIYTLLDLKLRSRVDPGTDPLSIKDCPLL